MRFSQPSKTHFEHMSNKLRLAMLVSLMGMFAVMSGCEEDETPDDPDVNNGVEVTVFTNQTGQPNETANGLQAQVSDSNNGSTVDFYGNFDTNGHPNEVSSIRVSRTNSDTVVNYIMNPLTNNFERAVFEVNGQRLNTLVKYDFPAGDTSMVLSHYNYNWSTGQSELIYSEEYFLNGSDLLYFNPMKTDGTQTDWVGIAGSIALSAAIVATGAAIGPGIAAVATAIAGAGTAVTLTTALVVTALASMNSQASEELTPQNVPTPTGTPVSNAENEDEPEPLPVNPCLNNGVNVTVGIDPGNTLVAIAQGGTYGPYDFYWSDGSTGSANTYHSIQVTDPGTYYAIAVDENGCSGSGFATIGLETSDCGTVTDIDGNVYNTVTIGAQCWMKENLKVSRYRNGDELTNATSYSYDGWVGIDDGETGAFVYPAGSAANNDIFGKTYNAWAAVDERNVCPVGWHVPSKIDWETLINYLGGSEVAGGKMKSPEYWQQPNVGASNSSGFTAFPSFGKNSQAEIVTEGWGADYWSNTQNNPSFDNWTWSISLTNDSEECDLVEGGSRPSGSIRCIKD